jgi:hypothetical protein
MEVFKMSLYSFKSNGRFGRLKETGEVVEIIYYDEPENGEKQELYFKSTEESLEFAYLDDFESFDIHSSYLVDNPLKFGDMVQLKDIPTSEFIQFDIDLQENYDLFLGKIGLITEVLEEQQEVFVAFKRDVVLVPIHLIEKIYEREIW